MISLLKAICGMLAIIIGLASIYFGAALLFAQQSWLMLGGFLVFFGIGFGFIDSGLSIVRGRDVKKSLWFMLTIGRRSP